MMPTEADDPKTPATDPGGQGVDDAPGAQPNEISEVEQLPAWAQKELQDLRAESKKRRLQLREQEQAAAKADEARLVEQAKWQELAEKRGKELEALTSLKEKADRYEQAFLANLEKRVASLPDQYKAIVPDFDDPVKKHEWLDANAHLFQQRRAPDIDAGAGNIDRSKGTPPKLTDAAQQLIAFAKQAGYDLKPDAIAARAKEIEEQQRRNPPKDKE